MAAAPTTPTPTTPTLAATGPVAEHAVPPVVAVVVTCDPGWWLEGCLRSLAAQDYPELSVLVVDADSTADPTARVAAVMPDAYVRRARRRRGFAAAANEVLGVVEGASHYLFCHDDVLLDTGAVRRLVEEAFRSNAGVVAPKLVGWFSPDRLLAAGMGADGFGVPVGLVERGELDQEQHDAVRDVFFAPGACALVRADLFATLGGFDAGYGPVGEDLDLSWRAHLVGARVVVAPAARVRHLEATECGQRGLDGVLQAVGPDAPIRARAAGLGTAPWPEDEEVALAPGSLGAAAPATPAVRELGDLAPSSSASGEHDPSPRPPDLGPVAPPPADSGAAAAAGAWADGASFPGASPAGDPADGAPPDGPAGAEAGWEADGWGEEPGERADVAGRHGGHRASRRARRGGERSSAADSWEGDEGWEVETFSSRRRARRAARVRAREANGPDRAARSVGPPAREPSSGLPAAMEVPRPDAVALEERRSEARLRAVATNYGGVRLLTRLPLLLVLTVVESLIRLLRAGPRQAGRPLRAWVALIGQSGSVRTRRQAVRRVRRLTDRQITTLQVRGTTRLRQALGTRPAPAPRAGLGWTEDGGRLTATVWLGVALVLAVGSRHLLGGHLPTIGELAPWPGVRTIAQQAWSGWRTTGLGTPGPAPTAFGLLAIAGAIFVGHTTLLQHVLVLGMVPLGAMGAAGLGRSLGSRRSALVSGVAYLAVPLPWDALARGRWSGLVAYAAVPWLIGLLAHATGLAPFTAPPSGGDGGPGEASLGQGGAQTTGSGRVPPMALGLARRVAAVALVTALAGAVQPGIIPLVAAIGVALALGSALVGTWSAGLRSAVVGALGAAAAVALLLPWSLGWLPPAGEWAGFSGLTTSGPPLHLATLLRFQTGPLGAAPLGYALAVAAALPLVIGRGWRSSWAVRLWVLALASFALAWAGQHGALGAAWPSPEVLLAPAAAALALSTALGMEAFDLDLSGYTFGWRQVASGVAALAAALACLPVLGAAPGGRWHQPSTGFDAVLSGIAQDRSAGDFRVLWLGSPDVLPVAGWRLDPGLAYATTRNAPSLTDRWPGTSQGPTRLLAQAVTLARRGQTTDLGRLLAPMAVRYVIVVDRAAPLAADTAPARPVAPDVRAGLESQLDLRRVDRSDAVTLYENDAWAPTRFRLADGAASTAALDDPRAARTVDLHDSSPAVLATQQGSTTFTGDLAPGAEIEVAESPSAHWRLTTGGRSATRQSAFGSANLFTTAAGGASALRYDTPVGWRIGLLVEVALWALALAVVSSGRPRAARRTRRPEGGPAPVALEQQLVGGSTR